jgi:choline-sulfatase
MPERPNILIITADQLRSDVLGCYGNTVCKTPHLDALAASGTLFERAYTPDPICVPARASITTGNYPHRAVGCKDNDGLIRDDQPILARDFGAAGYKTYACGKLHYVPYASPDQARLTHGFDVWDSCESGRILQQYDPANKLGGLEDYIDYLGEVGWGGYSRAHGIGNNDVRPCASPVPAEHNADHWVADRTIDRLRQHQADNAEKPFLMWCSFPKPHSPYDPPAEWANMYDPREVREPIGDESLLADRAPYMSRLRYTHALNSLSPEARRVIKAYYYALTSFHDAQVGRVLAELEAQGLAENTIVVYTADHGDLMGDFGTYFKCSFLEGSAHVPLIIRAAGMPANQRREQLAGLQDILPTLASLAGVDLDQDVHGIDLSAALAEEAAQRRELYYSQCFDAPKQMAMVTDGRWKFCWCQEGPTEELYDLAADPRELENLAGRDEYRDAVTQWRQRLADEARRLGDAAIFDDDGALVATPLDRSAIPKLPVRGMGWRWY